MIRRNKKQYQVDGEAFEVPRDPAEYQSTQHFAMRCKDRVPTATRDLYITQTIEIGELSAATPPQSVDNEYDICQHFEFEREFAHWTCRIIVGMRPIAARQDDKKHLALTIYNPEDHE
jgi:hypothetical protein